MIRFEQVGKRYPNGHVGLHELSFRVRRGEFLFVTGHSGAGKGTLSAPAAGHGASDQRQAAAGRPGPGAPSATRRFPFLRRQIGVVFQNHQLLFDRTVFNNVALPLQILGPVQGGNRQACGLGPGARGAVGQDRPVPRRPLHRSAAARRHRPRHRPPPGLAAGGRTYR